LYRSLLAGKRMLIVLDNARDAAQIRPLLPGTAGCLVLVTSRNQLTGLVAAEGARLINLEALTDNEARQLLAHRIGADRIAAEQETATELIALCVRLPLALSVAAARAVTQPAYSLAAMVTALRDEHGKLDALDTGEQASSLRAVFSWSYHTLGKPAATMFRLLGLHPGPDITAPAAASMAGIPLPQARRALSDLTTAHLLAEQIPGRFAFHDLLRTYAAEQARTYDPEYQQRTAIGRVLVHYLNTAHHATTALNSGRDLLTITPPRPGVTPELFLTSGAALAWFSTERQVLSAATILASDNQFDDLAWQLCYALGSFYLGNGYWQEWASTLSAGLTSAERLGDLNAQACINLDLGRACLLPGRCDDAHKYLRHALSRCQQSGNLAIQGHAHLLLSASRMRQGDLHEALDHARQALKLYRDANHQAGQANALNNVGWFLARLGNHQEALAYSEQALAVQQEIANRDGELHTWDTLGYTLHHLGHHTKAIACYHRALNLCHELGNRHTRGEALDHLGDTYLRIGNPQAARTAWQQALEIFDDLHHPDTRQVRAKLIQHQPIGRPKSADANSRGTSG
jgi:tetratricopeptide (TPR) repeat protein